MENEAIKTVIFVNEDHRVEIAWSQPIATLALDPDAADEMADALKRYADACRKVSQPANFTR